MDLPPITYESVSIRENTTGKPGSVADMPDGMMMTGVSLTYLIGPAYGKLYSVSGLPGWVETKRYDIQFKVAPDDVATFRKLKQRQQQQMLQLVMEERLKFKAHIITKDEPAYDLVVAKGGPKLHEAKPGDTYVNGLKDHDGKPIGYPSSTEGPDFFIGQGIPVARDLRAAVEQASGRPVVDKTGLTGKYDIELHWDPQQGVSGDEAPPAVSKWPGILEAVEEQLGLKLVPSKAPQPSLVVDHIELPTEN